MSVEEVDPDDLVEAPDDRATDEERSAARAERARVHRRLKLAHDGISAMRPFFWTLSVAAGLVATLASGWTRVLALAVCASCAVAALGVRKRPFWCACLVLGFALLAAATVVVASVVRGAPVGGPKQWIALAFFVAGAVWSARRMRQAEALLKEHPDSFAARRITGAERDDRRSG